MKEEHFRHETNKTNVRNPFFRQFYWLWWAVFCNVNTYICRGHVFANAQTGNIVLLGLHLTNQDWKKAFYYFVPILAFVLGILICETIQTFFKWEKSHTLEEQLVLLQLICLIFAGFMPLGESRYSGERYGFLCMLQVEAFRKMNGKFLCHDHVYRKSAQRHRKSLPLSGNQK